MAPACLLHADASHSHSNTHETVKSQAEKTNIVNSVVQNRLRITRRGLAELRELMLQGDLETAEMILEKIDEDCELLERRLG